MERQPEEPFEQILGCPTLGKSQLLLAGGSTQSNRSLLVAILAPVRCKGSGLRAIALDDCSPEW